MNVKIIIAFLLIINLVACSTKAKEKYNSKLTIKNEIKELTDIAVDTTKFIVQEDSIYNTEGTFDSDYTWIIKIQFDKNYFKSVKKNILSSKNFNTVTYEFDENWKKIDTTEIKGIWYYDKKKLSFVQNPKEYNPEPINISVDTLRKEFYIQIIHL